MPSHKHLLLSAVIVSCMLPCSGSAAPVQQDFVITAYYSPLPGQCCYIMGSEGADKDMNGHGTHGADGTAVYPGMAAAPGTYAFGTRIVLPGIGNVTVHDRGGAIVEQEHAHRLDLWMGSGEEGLARAIAFGVQRVRGTVYQPSDEQPSERLVFEDFDAPQERIAPYAVAPLSDIEAALGDRTWSVRLMQGALAAAGLFDHPVTGFFGAVTQESLRAFIARYALSAPDDRLTATVSAYLLAEQTTQSRSLSLAVIDRRSSKKEVQAAQRLLRGLGYYDGRTDGVYSAALKDAIVAFQKEQNLVGDASSPGAGRIGPKTLSALERKWKNALVRRVAARILVAQQVQDTLDRRGQLLSRTLTKGNKGTQVTLLQRFLARKGYFEEAKINGYYGDQTAAAVETFQRDRKLITVWSAKGAGTVGPLTLQRISQESVAEGVKRVSALGWSAL